MDKYSVLKETFGYTTFREGQEELVDALLSGRDGEPAECILYYAAKDVKINDFQIKLYGR
ncbi:MAG: hypothetical protein LIP11_08855 [Clostridiales bacterium]|nr:hypothetical protein [Clostridiales bacterium]